MREILFRGKTDKGKWVEGFYCPCCFGRFPCSPAIISKEGIDNDGWQPEKVIPETVGQYTGLTDKNDTKIFEGDIISIPFEEDRYPYEENIIHYENAEVYFDTERYGWYVKYADDDLVSLWEYDDRDIIVIGNIHDNPELLERGQ